MAVRSGAQHMERLQKAPREEAWLRGERVEART